MNYITLDAKDRRYVGKHRNCGLLRGVQCILLATKGKVGTHLDFFKAAFGGTLEEFIEIVMMQTAVGSDRVIIAISGILVQMMRPWSI